MLRRMEARNAGSVHSGGRNSGGRVGMAVILHGLHARPPLSVVLPAALQHVGLGSVTLVFPLLVAEAAGADAWTTVRYLELSMLAIGIGTLLQCLGRCGIGSGFLIPAVCAAVYLPISLAAARTGGLGAVAGLTIAAGLTEALLSRAVRRLRAYLPTEVVGIVVLTIGIILGLLGLRLMLGFGPGAQGAGGPADWGVGLAALAVIVGASVRGGPRLRSVAVLVGLAGGSLLHLAVGLAQGGGDAPAPASNLGTIVWPLVTPRWDLALLPGFLVGALACLVRASGDIVASQRANDPGWRRADFRTVRDGALADGLGTAVAGLLGTMGVNTYTGSVGLATATGITARRVGLAVGLLWVAFALLPGTSTVLLAIPRGVLGAALFFTAAFIVATGMSILAQRLLDARRTVVVGFAFVVALSYDALPDLYAGLPGSARGLLSSSLVLGMVCALGLNALLRIGVYRPAAVRWRPEEGPAALTAFMAEVGAGWGARAEAVGRACDLLEEFAEAAPTVVTPGEAAEITARFDEFNLDLVLRWRGEPLPAGPVALTLDNTSEGADDAAIAAGLAAVLLRRHADRVATATSADGRQELHAHIEH